MRRPDKKRAKSPFLLNCEKKMGLEAGGTVIAEEKSGELVLRPAAVVEIDLYTDEQVSRWDDEDRLDDQTREMILGKLGEKA